MERPRRRHVAKKDFKDRTFALAEQFYNVKTSNRFQNFSTILHSQFNYNVCAVTPFNVHHKIINTYLKLKKMFKKIHEEITNSSIFNNNWKLIKFYQNMKMEFWISDLFIQILWWFIFPSTCLVLNISSPKKVV